MPPATNRQIVLTSRPQGLPCPADFALVESAVAVPEAGQFVIRHSHLGLAPAARLRMGEIKSYAAPMALGDVVHSQAVGEVVASKHAQFKVRDQVVSTSGGWQEYSVSSGAGVSKIDTGLAPPTVWLGALGTSGQTAWVGLHDVAVPKRGETVVVSAAAGAVGSMAGQIARQLGCRIVGIAGGARKCEHVVHDLGFDACVDYRSEAFPQLLRDACPAGVDVYFDNVGGMVRDTVWSLLNQSGRVAVCGLISEYNDSFGAGPGWFNVLTRRLTVRGFIMSDHADSRGPFLEGMSKWYRAGAIRIREDIVDGLEQTVPAFIGMLQGKNFGKTIVRL
jgi:NADPH-dependent curcumin reductase CurA